MCPELQTTAMDFAPIAECSLSSAKIMQTSAMKTCFQIAECSLSSAKIRIKAEKSTAERSVFIKIIAVRYTFINGVSIS